MRNIELTEREVDRLISNIGHGLGYGYIRELKFPVSRHDVCVLSKASEDGSSYGFDTVYLVWKNKSEEIKYKELADSRSSKDYIHIDEIREDNGKIVVRFGSGGSYSGSRWDRESEIEIAELGLS